MKRLSKKLLYTLGVTLICGGMQLHAQSLDQAKKLYNDGKYAEAKTLIDTLEKYTTRPIVLTKPRRCSTNTSPS